LDPEDIKILSLGVIWNFGKGHGSPELISDYRTKRAIWNFGKGHSPPELISDYGAKRAIWNFGKGHSPPELISDYGAKRAIRPRCIGNVKGSNPMQKLPI
jgi:hypothetical protein